MQAGGNSIVSNVASRRAPALWLGGIYPREMRPPADLTALCEVCGTAMHRIAANASLATIMPKLEIQFREAGARIVERTTPSLNCDKQED